MAGQTPSMAGGAASGRPASVQLRGDEITLEVAGRLIMVGPERVRQLVRSGHIAKTRHGYTTIPSVVQGYIRFLKESARDGTQTASAGRAQEARAKEIELRISREERRLIPTEDAILGMGILCREVSAGLVGLPARVTRDPATRRTIEAELRGMRARLATALDRLSQYARDGGETPPSLT